MRPSSSTTRYPRGSPPPFSPPTSSTPRRSCPPWVPTVASPTSIWREGNRRRPRSWLRRLEGLHAPADLHPQLVHRAALGPGRHLRPGVGPVGASVKLHGPGVNHPGPCFPQSHPLVTTGPSPLPVGMPIPSPRNLTRVHRRTPGSHRPHLSRPGRGDRPGISSSRSPEQPAPCLQRDP